MGALAQEWDWASVDSEGKWAHPSQKWDGESGLHPCLVPQSLEGKTAPLGTSPFSL